jgi:hypothetical protein
MHVKGLETKQLRSPAADVFSSVLAGSYIDPDLTRAAGCADVLNPTVTHVDPIIKNSIDALRRVRQDSVKIGLMRFPRWSVAHEKILL